MYRGALQCLLRRGEFRGKAPGPFTAAHSSVVGIPDPVNLSWHDHRVGFGYSANLSGRVNALATLPETKSDAPASIPLLSADLRAARKAGEKEKEGKKKTPQSQRGGRGHTRKLILRPINRTPAIRVFEAPFRTPPPPFPLTSLQGRK